MNKNLPGLLALSLFGLAFALVEAAVVVYLRQAMGLGNGVYNLPHYRILLNLGAIVFLAPTSAIFSNPALWHIEMWREAATLLMLLSVAFIFGRSFRERLGAFLIAFSLWDIFYYLFLFLFIHWPTSLFSLDIYFLLPVPWIGPVITPLLISLILALLGFRLASRSGE